MHLRRTRAFTLIELLVVIAIIGLLSSVVLASLNTAQKKAEASSMVSTMNSIRTEAEIYYASHNAYGQKSTGSCSVAQPHCSLAYFVHGSVVDGQPLFDDFRRSLSTTEFVTDPTIQKAVRALNGDVSEITFTTTGNGKRYAVEAQMLTGGYGYCVDSQGFSGYASGPYYLEDAKCCPEG